MAKCGPINGCGVSCIGSCLCWGTPIILDSQAPTHNCGCTCGDPGDKPAKGGKKIPFMKFKRMIKENPQTRFNICARDASITFLAQSFDKVLPNRILVPANRLNKKVTLSLKNNTLGQIISASGLVLSQKPFK
jgi:hypothetical protein